MRVVGLFSQNVRQVLVAMIPFTFLGIQTIHYLTTNKPEAVENIGAFITIWALINISIGRTRYAQSITEWEKAQLSQYLKLQETEQRFRDEAVELTFDVHACQIAQMSAVMNVPNPFCRPERGALEEWVSDINRRFADGDRRIAMQEENAAKVKDFEAEYIVEVAKLKSWESFLWRLEIGMAIWGTLQGAFGAEVVNAFHSI